MHMHIYVHAWMARDTFTHEATSAAAGSPTMGAYLDNCA